VTRVHLSYKLRREQVAALILLYTAENGHPPVNHEIAEAFGMSKAWVSQLLDRMERDGIITRGRRNGVTLARTIKVVER
jgi:DNA-binding MarR family transcriptional regulator